jgi:hypothetical protein
MTFRIMHNVTQLKFVILTINDTEQMISITALYHYAECSILFIVMLNVPMLSVILLNVIMLHVDKHIHI